MKTILFTLVMVIILVYGSLSFSCPSGMTYIGDAGGFEVCKHYSENAFRGVSRGPEIILRVWVQSNINVTVAQEGPGGQRIGGDDNWALGTTGWIRQDGTKAPFKLQQLIEFCINNSRLR